MPYVGFNSIPTSNETACTLYVFGCGPAGDLAPGGTTVLTGASPGVGTMPPSPIAAYYWVLPSDIELNPPAFAQFTACSPELVVLTVYYPGALSKAIEVLPGDPASVADELAAAAARAAEREAGS